MLEKSDSKRGQAVSDSSLSGSNAGPEKIYLDALEKGIWQIQSCTECRKAIFYPRNVCPHCGGTALSWIAPSGNGTVYSSSTIHRSQEHGGDYNVSLIDLDEGARMMSTVLGCAPLDVKIGMPVKARIDSSATQPRVVFDVVEVGK
ncbi:DNA-binding protein (plasmid) [Diaphorobacter sp. HDW4B]|uniref:Zn-ribbon domain-containing OB-fold protein n=1 Tax=Diaphorobacter sp. HDW4B TaxID=2714925 RepID=UPI001408F0EC|nr:OB-fold domain-containing protein [Diaphorobacter sp. HDW4B]QIL74158.1 DNA-binding protein [Diaphorobacter sp. HDW4B]